MEGRWESGVHPGHCTDFSQSGLVIHSVRTRFVSRKACVHRESTQGLVHVLTLGYLSSGPVAQGIPFTSAFERNPSLVWMALESG